MTESAEEEKMYFPMNGDVAEDRVAIDRTAYVVDKQVRNRRYYSRSMNDLLTRSTLIRRTRLGMCLVNIEGLPRRD